MPRCFPEHPGFRDGGTAERVVWQAFRDQLPDDAVLFHGRRFQERQHEYEVDLLVGVPGAGWAVVEVKGGDVRYEAGVWEQRQKGVWQRVDPVGQAQDCRHVLQRHLKRHGVSAASSRAAHLVAFPHKDVPAGFSTPDVPRSMVIGRNDVDGAYLQLLRALQDHGQGHGPFDAVQVEEFVGAVVGPSLPQADLLAVDAENEARIHELTERQRQLVGFLRNQHRVAVVGGAGSGKTWLALEQARRLAKDGQAVALVCYSRGLGHFLRRVTAQWPKRERPAYVGLFHDLPVMWGAPRGAEDDSRWWEVDLPRRLGELAAERPVGERFDS
ncbi:MAG TPA: nuclease-related domain-containing protein, partial [Mycobacteriales bacterium]|nr:nuclease-related domain-containing protein [Mycobacteriales bacterium]